MPTMPAVRNPETPYLSVALPTDHPSLDSGWGNVMQDFVMMGLLAHVTNRS